MRDERLNKIRRTPTRADNYRRGIGRFDRVCRHLEHLCIEADRKRCIRFIPDFPVLHNRLVVRDHSTHEGLPFSEIRECSIGSPRRPIPIRTQRAHGRDSICIPQCDITVGEHKLVLQRLGKTPSAEYRRALRSVPFDAHALKHLKLRIIVVAANAQRGRRIGSRRWRTRND